MIIDELLLNFWGHAVERVELTLEVTSELVAGSNNLGHDLVTLLVGDAGSEREGLQVTSDTDTGGLDEGGVDEGEVAEGEVDEGGSDDDILPDSHAESDVDEYPVGAFVAAIYEDEWYIAQVEGEEPDEETDGFILLKYMRPTSQQIENSFVWPEKADILKTNIEDILSKVDPPIPKMTSRAYGLCEKDFCIVKNKMVKWFFFIFFFYLKFFIKCAFRNM